MQSSTAANQDSERGVERRGRTLLWIGLILAWVVMVFYMWDAVTAIPSAERLGESRLIMIPGPRTFVMAAIFSAIELGFVLAALWPWWPSYYPARLGTLLLGLVAWFITTTPVRELSRMDWVHRRWLAFMILTTGAALIVVLGYRLARYTADQRAS